jgi:hypothetical protein
MRNGRNSTQSKSGGTKTVQKPVAFSFIVMGSSPEINTKTGDPNQMILPSSS